MTSAFANGLRKLFLGVTEVFDQGLVSLGLFNGIEICALNVLHQRDFQRLHIIEVAYDHRHFVQLCFLGGPPTPFAGNDLVSAFIPG